MADETKKISFGFSKLKKQSNLVKPVEIDKPQIEYVDSFDGAKGKFSYKGSVRSDEPVKKELVIPMTGAKTVLELIASKLEENARSKDGKNNENNCESSTSRNENRNSKAGHSDNKDSEKEKQASSIDDLAAKEILNDLQNKAKEESSSNEMVIKQPAKTVEEKEIPIDYENVPVNDFGLAMLRGMGWTPKTGIGKEQRVVPVVTPKIRPKGLGLGADKVILQEPVHDAELTISMKSYVKFIGGIHKGKYGQIESMDEDNGRVIVKLALGGSVSASEMLLRPVTKKDYEKNSKIINSTQYSNYGEKPPDPGKAESKMKVTESRKVVDQDNSHRKEKYAREESGERSRRSRQVESDSEGRKEKRSSSYSSSPSPSSSSSSDGQRKKRGKSSSRDRKHKKSSERKRKKHKKHSSEYNSGSRDNERKRSREKSKAHKSKSKNGSHR